MCWVKYRERDVVVHICPNDLYINTVLKINSLLEQRRSKTLAFPSYFILILAFPPRPLKRFPLQRNKAKVKTDQG